MSKRGDIVSAMSTRFKAIHSGSGSYQTNLGDHVGVWRTVALGDAELPYLNLRDPSESTVDDTQGGAVGRMTQRQLTVEIEIVCSDMTILRKCQEDVELAIHSDETFGGLALRTQPISSEVLAVQDRDAIGGMLITVRVDYRSGRWSAS